jgi:hypothetical protein
MYEQKIKELETNIRKLDNEIFLLEKQGSTDKEKIKVLSEKKMNNFNELRRLYRLQYEENHERVHFDDDR